MRPKIYFVYILSNGINTVTYTGVTGDLKKRVWQHKEKVFKGFTSKYNISKLVYCEPFNDIRDAIAREKQIKASSREKKVALVTSMNPEWNDLYYEL